MVRDRRIPDGELLERDRSVRASYPTGEAAEFEAAIEYHEGLPESADFARALESADRPLLQPRAGVPRLDDQVPLLEHLHTEGGADLLPTTIDSYTRTNDYEEAAAGLADARDGDPDALNGFPAVVHGVDG
jgi:methylaspartate mutase epsilon subunit